MFVISYRFKNCHGDNVPVVLYYATESAALWKATILKNCRDVKGLEVKEANKWRIG